MKYDVVIIGAGIIGLAAAHKLVEADPNLRIAVLEKEAEVACHQTGHNSGVIHSGVYYKPGSEKARNCRRGYSLLLDFLKSQQISHEICGKIIVATRPEQMPMLEEIKKRGEQNGLDGLKLLNSEQARNVEPHVRAHAALWVPQAGIVNYKQVSIGFYEKLKSSVDFHFATQVLDIREAQSKVFLMTQNARFETSTLVNCAGLYSDAVVEMLQWQIDVRIIPFRGEYFMLKPEAQGLVRNLIYPVPDPRFPFLGVHFTRMIDGGIEAGPNAVLALAKEGYRWSDVNAQELFETLTWPGFSKVALKYWEVGLQEVWRSFSKARFTQSLQELVPEIKMSDLVSGGSGVRAQACARDGALLDDFLFVEGARTIHVLNAPSPAATSCLAIGETIAKKWMQRFK
jgi:L-2-hydroxyglutarate oxidase